MSFIHSTAPDGYVKFFVYKKELMAKDGKEISLKDSEDNITIDVVSEIISISTSKQKSGGGSFSIVLGSNTNWKSLISLGSWCSIHISDRHLNTGSAADQNCGMKMFGRVKSIRRRESLNPASGAKIVRYVISGEDFHSVLMNKIYLNPVLVSTGNAKSSGNQKTDPATLREVLLFGGKVFKGLPKPDFIINNLIDAVLGEALASKDAKTGKQVSKTTITTKVGMPIHVPSTVMKYFVKKGGRDFASLLTRFTQQDLYGKLTSVGISIGETVDLWSMIETYAHRILNEVYTELLPLKLDDGSVHLVPGFVLRAIPFSSKHLVSSGLGDPSCISYTSAMPLNLDKKLSKIKSKAKGEESVTKTAHSKNSTFFISKYIQEDEIMAFDSGRSDHSVFNFFFVGMALFGENSSITAHMQGTASKDVKEFGNIASQGRFGFRPFITTSIYNSLVDDKKSPDFLKALNAPSRIVRDLWENAHLYESGSVVIIGSHLHIPVGTNIVFSERGWMAHVEGVNHTFSVDGSSGIKSFSTAITFSRLSDLKGNPIDTQEKGDKSGTLGEWDRSANKGGS